MNIVNNLYKWKELEPLSLPKWPTLYGRRPHEKIKHTIVPCCFSYLFETCLNLRWGSNFIELKLVWSTLSSCIYSAVPVDVWWSWLNSCQLSWLASKSSAMYRKSLCRKFSAEHKLVELIQCLIVSIPLLTSLYPFIYSIFLWLSEIKKFMKKRKMGVTGNEVKPRWELDYDLLENEGLFGEYLEMGKARNLLVVERSSNADKSLVWKFTISEFDWSICGLLSVWF